MGGKNDQAAGKAKELIGKATGDESMEGRGKAQHAGGKVKQGAHDAKESVKGAARGVGEAFDGDAGHRR